MLIVKSTIRHDHATAYVDWLHKRGKILCFY